MQGNQKPPVSTVRAMFFIDFWNYELTMKELEPTFLTDWFNLPKAMAQETCRVLGVPIQYERCFIFGSYDPYKDMNLQNWANTLLPKIPGVSVHFSPRQKRAKGPCCTGKGHHEVRECPYCQASMLGTQEKGVDTQIAMEMFDMAYSGLCDIMVLVSADKDFIPAVKRIWRRGVKVVHAYFPGYGHELAKESWGSFDLFKIRGQFRRGRSGAV